MSVSRDFTPYKRSDFFFTTPAAAAAAASETWNDTSANQCITAKSSETDCKMDYVREIERNRALYRDLTELQTNSASSEQRFHDVGQKYERDMTSITTNALGCIILLALIYNL